MENQPSKFKNLYKSSNKTDLQECRRRELLEKQKLQRSLFQDECRNLQTILLNTHHTKKFKQRTTFKKKYKLDAKLQLSEWLKEKPENLNDWYLVPCPKGQRCMVVACNGYTEMYNKSGRLIDTFKSLLPGNVSSKNDITILDCVYVEKTLTFYVLDALAYGNQDLINCETQFRFFWLKSKFLESNFEEIGPDNQYSFVFMKFYDFEDTTSVSIALQKYPLWEENCPELDGFLFYHKEASYTFGVTPLVGWLFAFMVPEVLDYDVHSEYMLQKPENYSDSIKYIIEFDEMLAKKKYSHKQKVSVVMDQDLEKDDNNFSDGNGSLKSILEAEKMLELEEDITDDNFLHSANFI